MCGQIAQKELWGNGKRSKQAESRQETKENSCGLMAISTMSEEDIITRLKVLEDDPTMKSESIYSPAATQWPSNQLPFIERHLAYLRTHKTVDPEHYISNLALMIKRR